LELTTEDLPDGGFGFEYCCNRSFVVDNVLIERFGAAAEAGAPQEQFRKELGAEKKPLDEAQQKRSALNERPGKIAWVSDVSETPPEVFLLERGDYGKPSMKVDPSGLGVLSDEAHPFAVRPPSSPAKTTGRRLAFAEWATAPGSPRAALL